MAGSLLHAGDLPFCDRLSQLADGKRLDAILGTACLADAGVSGFELFVGVSGFEVLGFIGTLV